LAGLSHPQPSIDVRNQCGEAVELANILAQNIHRLTATDCADLSDEIKNRLKN